ncbi:hypothetical protein ETB97_001583 [Aspergillus alliaceus]|uniref:Major facilitator superfamily (MFS) profile domain-containing protein n=1 Tax=Petromyces alliaceus TaxID=209559 RepID=A0A8H6AF89_PETAA|nr:hypothetical protein ETB97_001583 [Aspergillus burnettii]
MSPSLSSLDPEWPPGTVRLEDLSQTGDTAEVILQPKPTRDPNDPLNWPLWRKNLNFGLVCYYVVMVLALINIATVTWGPVNLELGFSYALLNYSYAAGCGSLCIGGLFLIPFALKYGRRPIYIFSTAFQCGISIWSGKMQTVADLILVNILNCIVGALAEVLVQMTVADIYFVHQRGLASTVYIFSMTVGATLAPLAGGFITQTQGWRWVWWWLAIFFGVGLVAFVFLYEETMFEPSYIDGIPASDQNGSKPMPTKKNTEPSALEESRSTQDGPSYEAVEVNHSIPVKSYMKKLALWTNSPLPFSAVAKHCYQPFLILFSFPGVFFMALVFGLMTACMTVPVTTLSSVMTLPPYSFNASQIGLMGLPLFIGTALGALISGPLSDWIALFLAKRNGGVFEPEMRLWLALAFTPLVPAGLFIFGIGLNNGSHWLLPAFGLGVTSVGSLPASSAALTYLTDSYTEIIADSLVAVTFIRNLISTIFVFALQPWYNKVGLTWFYVTFGLIVTACLMGNVLFIYYGKMLRASRAAAYIQYSYRQFGSRPT